MRAMIGAGGHDDADAAALFVRAQVSWLRRGLERADDSTAVAMVLAVHDSAHREWLELLPRLDGPARAAADELYAFCGRVAGALQRGPDPRLPAATSAAVRALHAERLTALARATEMGIMGNRGSLRGRWAGLSAGSGAARRGVGCSQGAPGRGRRRLEQEAP